MPQVKQEQKTEISEMEDCLRKMLERVRAGEIKFLAVTATDFNGVIEQSHLRNPFGKRSNHH